MLQQFAPAKINLYLHVTGKLDNGYHTLESLAVFADTGDMIEISEAQHFSFKASGPFANSFSQDEQSPAPGSSNIVVRAAYGLAEKTGRKPNVSIKLIKNLPLGAGIGGGSADAAATLKALCRLWNIQHDAGFLPDLMLSLGADVPVCFYARPAIFRGIGEYIFPVRGLPGIPAVLVYPGHPSATENVFRNFPPVYRNETPFPESINDLEQLYGFLKSQNNDLTEAASKSVPGISAALKVLSETPHCRLVRMSGSGSTCFGLYETVLQAENAAKMLQQNHPSWWVRETQLGGEKTDYSEAALRSM